MTAFETGCVTWEGYKKLFLNKYCGIPLWAIPETMINPATDMTVREEQESELKMKEKEMSLKSEKKVSLSEGSSKGKPTASERSIKKNLTSTPSRMFGTAGEKKPFGSSRQQ